MGSNCVLPPAHFRKGLAFVFACIWLRYSGECAEVELPKAGVILSVIAAVLAKLQNKYEIRKSERRLGQMLGRGRFSTFVENFSDKIL